MNGLLKKTLLSLAVAAGVAGMIPSQANAGDDDRYGDRHGRDYRHGDEDRRPRSEVKFDFDFSTGRTSIRRETDYRPRYVERRVKVWVEPVYRTESTRVWVEPVYRTETQRVWVEPVYQTVYEDVRVPERWEVRETVRYERGRKVIIRERVLVEPACIKRVPKQVCVSEGRWDVVEKRVCVSEGRFDVVERRVCVNEGHWDYRVERAEVRRHEEETVLDVRF